ncbi:hypothetical protein LSAT2_024826 [Lamellibrachia satsuma]|nr:hypothetical protein LSAT2_024826 [Lamellibrachia satsuma]
MFILSRGDMVKLETTLYDYCAITLVGSYVEVGVVGFRRHVQRTSADIPTATKKQRLQVTVSSQNNMAPKQDGNLHREMTNSGCIRFIRRRRTPQSAGHVTGAPLFRDQSSDKFLKHGRRSFLYLDLLFCIGRLLGFHHFHH